MNLPPTALRLGALASVAVIATLSLLPAKDIVRTGAPHGVEHFVAYAGAAAISVAAVRRRTFDIVAVTALFVLLAVGLELLQHFADGRTPKIANFLESAAGAIAGGLGLATLRGIVLRPRGRLRERSPDA